MNLSLSTSCVLLVLLLACTRGPEFTYKQVHDDLAVKIKTLELMVKNQPELEQRLEALKASTPEEKAPSEEEIQAEPVEDYESRLGLGYPYLLDMDLYTAEEQTNLKSLQTKLDQMGKAAEPVFKLEAETKVWERANPGKPPIRQTF